MCPGKNVKLAYFGHGYNEHEDHLTKGGVIKGLSNLPVVSCP